MKQRAAKVVLVLALLVLAGGAVFQAVTRSSAVEQARSLMASSDAAVARTDAALAELAAAQRGYVAPGQGLEFWSDKVDEAVASAGAALTTLRGAAPTPGAVASIDSALSRLSDFSSMDARARQYARDGQRAAASDLIFADGYEILAAARQDAAAAATATRAAASATLERDARVHLASIGVLGLLAAIGLLSLLRAPAVGDPVIAAEPIQYVAPSARTTDEDEIGAALDASLAGLAAAPDEDADAFAPARPVAPTPAVAPVAVAASVPAAPTVDLSAAADVCVDLARLLDARDLQTVLERAASAIGASGIVVWVADPNGATLSPVLTHGYAPPVVARLGSIATDSDNATAAAWRELNTQVVGGAVAVPMITSNGCTGVMSLELPRKNERASDVQSLARILAAQLAVVIAPSTQAQNRQAI